MEKQEIIRLKKDIEKQKEINIQLFKSIPSPLRDPNGEKAEPILKKWRDGSRKIKELDKQLMELEQRVYKNKNKKNNNNNTFINSYGEATSISYERNQKKIAKNILSLMR